MCSSVTRITHTQIIVVSGHNIEKPTYALLCELPIVISRCVLEEDEKRKRN